MAVFRRTTLLSLGLLGVAGFAAGVAAGELPEQIRKEGALHLVVNAIYPPLEFKDPSTDTLIGLDIDLGVAIGNRLGLKVVWQEAAFEQLIPALQTGRTDFILSGLNDLPARRESMDFIDYLRSGAQFYTLAASKLQTPGELCGKRVGTGRGTAFPAQIAAWSSENCEAAGKPAIAVAPADSTADARSQLRQGRIDAAVQGAETIPYAMGLEPNTYRVLGDRFTTLYQGMAFRKADTGLRDAVADALAGLIADGSYGKLMAKWNLPGHAMDAPLLNGEPRP